MHRHLDPWKSKLLSRESKLALLKRVLSNLQIYYMSLLEAPKSVIQKLEQTMGRFLWGSAEGEDKIPLIGWRKVCTPMEHGGLGVRPLKAMNQALLCKWLWKFGDEKLFGGS